jgi:hypothetical protein
MAITLSASSVLANATGHGTLSVSAVEGSTAKDVFQAPLVAHA